MAEGSIAADELKLLIERIERGEEEKKEAADPSATRKFGPPAGWDPAKDGECGTLEIADVEDARGHPFMESLWRPTADDLARLNAGACIALGIGGTKHPVVYVGTTVPPQHDGVSK